MTQLPGSVLSAGMLAYVLMREGTPHQRSSSTDNSDSERSTILKETAPARSQDWFALLVTNAYQTMSECSLQKLMGRP